MPVSECVHPGTGHAKEDGRAPPPEGNLLNLGGGTKLFPPLSPPNILRYFLQGNVPERPLPTHRDEPPLIISESSVATMGIFPSREKSSVLCGSKSPGVS